MPARSQFAAAIASAEGFGVAGAIPTRNNNPGDLRNWPGVPTDASGYSVFSSEQDGWDALEAQLNSIRSGASQYYNPNMTFAQMGKVYAGGDLNWAVNVAAYFGTTTNAMIGPFLSGAPAFTPVAVIDPSTGMVKVDGTSQGVLLDMDAQTALLLAAIGVGFYLVIRRFA